MIDEFSYDVDYGQFESISDVLEWRSPGSATAVNITVISMDSDRNVIVRETFTLNVILSAEAK